MPGTGEWLIILLIVLVLFGGTRIPQLARSLGEGLKEFRKSVKETPENEGDRPKLTE